MPHILAHLYHASKKSDDPVQSSSGKSYDEMKEEAEYFKGLKEAQEAHEPPAEDKQNGFDFCAENVGDESDNIPF